MANFSHILIFYMCEWVIAVYLQLYHYLQAAGYIFAVYMLFGRQANAKQETLVTTKKSVSSNVHANPLGRTENI